MSGEVSVSAPGKTILFGDHAAVYGHPALVTALDHRMTVAASASASSGSATLRVELPSLHVVRTVAMTHAVPAVREPGDLAILAVTIATAELERPPAGMRIR